jgi:DNA-binding transcriptional MerR regulator
MKGKSDNALRTIGELAEIIEVPAHVLRFWETKFSQLKPVKLNNRRYYDQKNIDLFKQIKNLLYIEKYTISQAIDLLKQQDKPESLKQLSLFNTTKKETSAPTKNDIYLAEVKEKLIQAKNKLNALLQS